MPNTKPYPTPVWDSADTEQKATIAAGGADAAPSTTTAGVDCENWEYAAVGFKGGASLTAATGKVYVLPKGGAGTDWIESGSDRVALSASVLEDVVNLNVSAFARIAARCPSPTGDAVVRYVTRG